jgi:hypothetical protein
MGNYVANSLQKKGPEEPIKEVYFQAKGIFEEYQTFIKDDDGKRSDKDHINGGISSGVSSSSHFTLNGIYVEVWYSITFMDLVRGRYKLIQKWIEDVHKYRKAELSHLQHEKYKSLNNLDKDENLKSYVTKIKTKKEHFTEEDLSNIFKIPKDSKESRGKVFITNFKNLLLSIGFPNYKPFLKSLKSLMKEKEGRCTSDLRTFLSALREKDIMEKAEEDKPFYVSLSFTHIEKSHQQMYQKEKERIEKIIDEVYDKPVLFVYKEGMKEGDTIQIKYDMVIENGTVKKEFDWVISKDYLKDRKIGDKIILKRYHLPDDLDMEMMRHRWSAQKKETAKINKPVEIKRKYHISFDIDSIEDFQQQFLEASQKFIQETNIFKKAGGFGEYKLY